MNDMLNSLEGFDSGSNYKFGDKMDVARPPRSLFDLSHLNTLTINNAGTLIPIGLWHTLPNDDFDINVDCLLRVMPQVVPLYSRQRLYVYGFYSRYSDLWNNWQVFIDKGYTGNVNKAIPVLHNATGGSSANVKYANGDTVTADSLFDYIGLPVGASMSALAGADISALPFMMYLRIYRDYFMNKNEWINDRVMLPDDDSRFRLNDDGHLLSAVDEGKTISFEQTDDITLANNNYSFGLLYHDYPDDYFTSALPFTQRGTTPQLNFSVDPSQITALTTGYFNFDTDGGARLFTLNKNLSNIPYLNDTTLAQIPPNTPFGLNMSGSTPSTAEINRTQAANLAAQNSLTNGMHLTTNLSGDSIQLGVTLEQIRELAIKQIELEKMARTDGSYKQFGLSFFGEVSKAAYDFRPTYIGGTYKNITFTEVLQTSGSNIGTTDPSDTSPLGAYSGHGITGISNGRIGHIHCDDYGLIMLIACIMPDVYYSQGLDRVFTDNLETDFYKPERAKLGMQPILNKELFYAGNNGNDVGEDNYLWAYQNPYDYLRYIPNKIHGKIADTTNLSFFPYTQSRKFTSLPNWGRAFSEAKAIRKDYLYAANEDAYSAQFSMNIRAVRPIPYKATPAQIIN